MKLHIYAPAMQPATGWVDTHSGEPRQMGFEPDVLIWALCCRKQRPAKDCVVQSCYDGLNIWCAPDNGCKDPRVIAAKKAREFANRSAGQKARRARASGAREIHTALLQGQAPLGAEFEAVWDGHAGELYEP